MALVMKNNISKMTTTTGPYFFHEIFHDQISNWLPYVLDSLTNSILGILNRSWFVDEDVLFQVVPKEAVADVRSQDLDGQL